MYKFGQLSTDRMQGVDKKLQEVAMRALRKSARRHDGGIDFAIGHYGGLRTAEEQNALFKKGVSKADGYNKKSYHQTGLALDVIPYVKVKGVKGNAIYTKKVTPAKRVAYFSIVAICMLEAANEIGVPLTAGINWQSFSDAPHYQTIKQTL